MLGHAEAKKAVDVIATQFDHRGPGLQVEGEGRGEEGQEGEEEMLYYEDIESPEIRDNWESYPLGIKNQEKNKTNDIFNK